MQPRATRSLLALLWSNLTLRSPLLNLRPARRGLYCIRCVGDSCHPPRRGTKSTSVVNESSVPGCQERCTHQSRKTKGSEDGWGRECGDVHAHQQVCCFHTALFECCISIDGAKCDRRTGSSVQATAYNIRDRYDVNKTWSRDGPTCGKVQSVRVHFNSSKSRTGKALRQ